MLCHLFYMWWNKDKKLHSETVHNKVLFIMWQSRILDRTGLHKEGKRKSCEVSAVLMNPPIPYEERKILKQFEFIKYTQILKNFLQAFILFGFLLTNVDSAEVTWFCY